jgi:hypothetical protein
MRSVVPLAGHPRPTPARPFADLNHHLLFLSSSQDTRRVASSSSSSLDPSIARYLSPFSTPLLRQPPPWRLRRPRLRSRTLLDRLPRNARERAVRRSWVRCVLCVELFGCALGGEHGSGEGDRGAQDVLDGGEETLVPPSLSFPLPLFSSLPLSFFVALGAR